ncbi:MAG: hypothetical protein PHI34_15310 [Acidobacteriota bacterium]|nr:hypothetical protein [Acidobacteriota bacterium]
MKFKMILAGMLMAGSSGFAAAQELGGSVQDFLATARGTQAVQPVEGKPVQLADAGRLSLAWEAVPGETPYAKLKNAYEAATSLPTREDLTGYIWGAMSTESAPNDLSDITLVGREKTVAAGEEVPSHGPWFPGTPETAKVVFLAIPYSGHFTRADAGILGYRGETVFVPAQDGNPGKVETTINLDATTKVQVVFRKTKEGLIVSQYSLGKKVYYCYYWR